MVEIPKELDGATLTEGQRACIAEMVIKALFEAGHPVDTAVGMAIECFRRLHEKHENEWRALREVKLSSGHGVIRSKFHAREQAERAGRMGEVKQ